MNKILIVGSSPSVIEIEEYKNRLSFVFDKIYCINNAWFLLKDVKKLWAHSTDYWLLGFHQPTDKDKENIIEEITNFKNKPLWYDQTELGSGTMFLNTLYHAINEANEGDEIYFLGCDFDYSDKSKTHFYGKGLFTEETNDLLKQNAPDFSDIAADPFRYGFFNLKKEVDKTVLINKVKLISLSSNPNQLLPYKRESLEYFFEIAPFVAYMCNDLQNLSDYKSHKDDCFYKDKHIGKWTSDFDNGTLNCFYTPNNFMQTITCNFTITKDGTTF